MRLIHIGFIIIISTGVCVNQAEAASIWDFFGSQTIEKQEGRTSYFLTKSQQAYAKTHANTLPLDQENLKGIRAMRSDYINKTPINDGNLQDFCFLLHCWDLTSK